MKKQPYFVRNTHQAFAASSNRYPSFVDNDGEVVFILPFWAMTINDLISQIEGNEDLRAFLFTELTQREGVFTLEGMTFWGADIHDHLPSNS